MTAPPTFSLVIPNWNRAVELERLLNSIYTQCFPEHAYEIIIIDNASTDDSAAVLANTPQNVTVIQNTRNMGACIARNQGIEKASGQYIWFLDTDTEFVKPDVMEQAARLLEQTPDTGSLGAEIFPPAPNTQSPVLCVKNLLPNWEVTNSLQSGGSIHMRQCDFLPTCNCIVPTKLMFETGGFDPGYFIMSEDQELGFRLAKAGYKNYFDSRICVYHHLSKNARRADLFLKSKNRIRSVLINAPLKHILLLPFYDMKTMLGKQAGSEFLNAPNNPNVQKYMKGLKKHLFKKGKPGQMAAMFMLAAEFATTLCAAYLVNLATLPQSIKQRKNPINHLHPINQKNPAKTENEQ